MSRMTTISSYRCYLYSRTNLLEEAPNRETVAPILVVPRTHTGRIHVQAVHLVSIVESTRPEVAVATLRVSGGGARGTVGTARERGT